MDTIQSKMTLSVVDQRPLLCVIIANPFATKRKRPNDSLAVESNHQFGGFQKPSNSTNQLHFGTFQTFKRKLKPSIVSVIEF
jgi:hypothetical protein